MPLRRKIAITAAAGCIAAGILGASASPASAVSVELNVGLNSPKGTHTTVFVPEAATPGVLTGFTQVSTKGPGGVSNIDVLVTP